MKKTELKEIIKEEVYSTLTDQKMVYEIGHILATELPDMIGRDIENIYDQIMIAVKELYIPKR